MAQHTRAQRRNPDTAAPSATSGSQTILQSEQTPNQPPSATLRLRATGPETRRHIQWAEDVVDNEGMGKKSSKVCCIYHKPHEPGHSDSEDDSSSSSGESGSDDGPDLSRAQKAGGKGKGRRKQGHGHGEENDDKGKGKERRPSPNAYERQPHHKVRQDR